MPLLAGSIPVYNARGKTDTKRQQAPVTLSSSFLLAFPGIVAAKTAVSLVIPKARNLYLPLTVGTYAGSSAPTLDVVYHLTTRLSLGPPGPSPEVLLCSLRTATSVDSSAPRLRIDLPLSPVWLLS